jgi:hypothetical protein
MKIRDWSMMILAALAMAGAGCRDGSGDDADGGNGDDGGGEEGDTIQEVQAASMPIGTAVELRGVVVVAIDNFGARTGGLYVMEPGGGAYSGVYVFLSGTGAAGLAVGDLVDVVDGVKDEFTLETDACERTSDCTITEISPPDGGAITVTKVGTAPVPEPQLLDPWDLADDDSEAEKWEGVLIEFENVRVTSAPRGVSDSDVTLKEMTVTGPFRVGSSLTELADTIEREYCFQNLVGIGDYFFEYKLLPRSAADIGAEGTGCLAEEEGETACGDEEDNDHDGFADCADFSCQESVASCTLDATVVECQNGSISENTAVALTGVVVTAIDRDRLSLWVQDEGVTAQHNGIYVFRGESDDDPPPTELDAAIVVGRKVDITGKMASYYGSTQIDARDGAVTDATGTATVVIIPGADSSTLGALTSGAPWEGALVQFTDIPVLGSGDYGQITIGEAGSPLTVDDTLFSYNPIGTTCLASITGVVIMNTYDDYYFLAPRSAADIVKNGDCD